MKIEHKISLLMSFGRSLLGEVTESLRAAAARVEGSTIYIYFFCNADVTEEMKEDLDSAYSEVYAPVPLEVFGPILIEKRVYPEPLPDIGVYVFSRDTRIPKQIDRSEIIHNSLEFQLQCMLYQSLLGRIPLILRSVSFDCVEKKLNIYFWLDEGVTDEDFFSLKEVTREIITDFPELKTKEHYTIIRTSKALPKTGTSVFLRKEKPIVSTQLIIQLFLSFQNALLGVISSSLRAAAVWYDDKKLWFTYVLNHEISEEETKVLGFAAEKVNREFNSAMDPVEVRFIKNKFPESLPTDAGIYVFSRDDEPDRQIQTCEMQNLSHQFQGHVALGQALFGRIIPNLRAAQIKTTNRTLDVYFWLDQKDMDTTCLKAVICQIEEQLPGFRGSMHCIISPCSKPIPKDNDYVFMRKETIQS